MGIIYTLLMIGILIFVHELGHFIVAKMMNVKVLKFSLGFGTPVFSFRRGETVYQVSWILFGGYVKMLGENPDEELPPEEAGRSFFNQSPLTRLLIVIAGPLMNLLFPFLIYYIVYAAPSQEISNRIGMVMEGRPAEAAGIQNYDRIIEVDGKRTDYWRELLREISKRPGKTVEMKVERDGKIIALTVNIAEEKEVSKYGFTQVLGRIGVSPYMPASVIFIPDENSAAYKAGLRSFDQIKKVDGIDAESFFRLSRILDEKRGREVKLEILRGEEKKKTEIVLTAAPPETLGFEQAELYIYKVEKDSPADKAGLRAGDKLVSVNGSKLVYFAELESFFAREPDREHEFGVLRGSELLNIKVRLEKQVKKDDFKQEYNYFVFGASNNSYFTDGDIVKKGFSPLDAIDDAIYETVDVIKATAVGVYQLLTGQISFKTVGGPIMIFGIAGKAAKKGMSIFLNVMALISINLGIINLLPLPVLDGGHIIMSLIEMIIRRPIPVKARVVVNLIGIVMILALTVLVLFNDIIRYSDDITSFIVRLFLSLIHI
ncbi:MAG: RIP metalloprotease RseP, partial [Deltaproteobacteria bacterium]|nr:RIP metalloprotease RseP [Deltaproteobacteria bacterium]